MKKIMVYNTMPNLFVNAHGSAQVGDAGAIPTAIAELLLQSHEGVIDILPTLPQKWEEGRVKGLRARGGYTVDIEWKDGQFKRAVIHPRYTGECKISIHQPVKVTCEGIFIRILKDENSIVSFFTEEGKSYEINYFTQGMEI